MYRGISKILSGVVAALALSLAACGSGGGGSADNSVAATVNGRNIMMSEVERLINQQSQGRQSQLSPVELAQARLQVLDSLIQREVLFQRAEQEKLLPSEEQITAAINEPKQQGGITEEEFQRKLKEQNLTEQGLREEARKDLAIKNLQDKYSNKISISDREVEEYYSNNKQQFVNTRGVELAMIVVDPADNSAQGIQNDAKGEAEAKQKVDDIYRQLKGGADFATVARARSEDRDSLLNGGDIGFASEEDLRQNGFPADVVAQLFGPMKNGDITKPVRFTSPRYRGGRWYIFKLQDKRLQNENLTLESPNVRQQITLKLTKDRKDVLNTALLEVALTEAKIVNNLAANMMNNPSNLGLRPASAEAAKPGTSPAASPAAQNPASPSPAASRTPRVKK